MPLHECDNCHDGLLIMTETILHSHLIIDIHTPDIESSYDLTTVLSDIPKNILVRDKSYTVRAAINFISPRTRAMTSIGHYIPYCYREIPDVWEAMDDLSSS